MTLGPVVGTDGRRPLSEQAQLLGWLFGLRRVEEAGREEANAGMVRAGQAVSPQRCPSLGQSVNCGLRVLVIPVRGQLSCLIIICLLCYVFITL